MYNLDTEQMHHPAHMTKRRSIRELFEATGLTLAECERIIAKLPSSQIGERHKVHRDDLLIAIAKHSQPARVQTIKPLSQKHRTRIRATAITERVLNSIRV